MSDQPPSPAPLAQQGLLQWLRLRIGANAWRVLFGRSLLRPTSIVAACVVLAPNRLDVNRTVKERLGTRKASFAPAEDTRAITGMEIGGVTVFGLPAALPIWVDARVMTRERIVVGGGSRSWKVLIDPAMLRRIPNVEVVEGLATDPVPREPAPEA